jgi:hypothetical protein
MKLNFPNGQSVEVPDPVPDPDMTWLFSNRARLEQEIPGKWIAIKGGALVGVGDTPKEAGEQAGEKGFRQPLLTCIRAKEFQGITIIPAIRRTS